MARVAREGDIVIPSHDASIFGREPTTGAADYYGERPSDDPLMAIDVQQHFVPPSLVRAYRDAGTGHADRRDVTEPPPCGSTRWRQHRSIRTSFRPGLGSIRQNGAGGRSCGLDLERRALDRSGRPPGSLRRACDVAFAVHGCGTGRARTDAWTSPRAWRGRACDTRDGPSTLLRWNRSSRPSELEPPCVGASVRGGNGRGRSFLSWRIGYWLTPVVETSLAVARLILSGLLDRVRSLVLIVPHLGGVLPFLAQRIEDLSGRGDARDDLTAYLRTRCYFDNCSYHAPALKCALATEWEPLGSWSALTTRIADRWHARSRTSARATFLPRIRKPSCDERPSTSDSGRVARTLA